MKVLLVVALTAPEFDLYRDELEQAWPGFTIRYVAHSEQIYGYSRLEVTWIEIGVAAQSKRNVRVNKIIREMLERYGDPAPSRLADPSWLSRDPG